MVIDYLQLICDLEQQKWDLFYSKGDAYKVREQWQIIDKKLKKLYQWVIKSEIDILRLNIMLNVRNN